MTGDVASFIVMWWLEYLLVLCFILAYCIIQLHFTSLCGINVCWFVCLVAWLLWGFAGRIAFPHLFSLNKGGDAPSIYDKGIKWWRWCETNLLSALVVEMDTCEFWLPWSIWFRAMWCQTVFLVKKIKYDYVLLFPCGNWDFRVYCLITPKNMMSWLSLLPFLLSVYCGNVKSWM